MLHRIVAQYLAVVFDDMLVGGGQMFDRIAIGRGFAADMLGGDERVARAGEFGAIDAEHDGAVAFEKRRRQSLAKRGWPVMRTRP